jgi:hypothetical protein
MPIEFGYGYRNDSALWREAERQVRAKFPGIIEGSSGWRRAVACRMKRVRRSGSAR